NPPRRACRIRRAVLAPPPRDVYLTRGARNLTGTSKKNGAPAVPAGSHESPDFQYIGGRSWGTARCSWGGTADGRVFIVAKQRKPGKKLEDFDKEEGEAKDKARDRRRGDVDYTDFQHDPVLEDEYFGGFRPTDDRSEGSLKARPERAKVLFLLPVEQRGFSRYRQRSPGWADDRLWGL